MLGVLQTLFYICVAQNRKVPYRTVSAKKLNH